MSVRFNTLLGRNEHWNASAVFTLIEDLFGLELGRIEAFDARLINDFQWNFVGLVGFGIVKTVNSRGVEEGFEGEKDFGP